LSLGGDGLGFYSLSARSLFTQGQLAIAPSRLGDTKTAFSIIDSLKQRAVDADFKPGDEKEAWQGVQRPLGEREPRGQVAGGERHSKRQRHS
jgi:hypothetical protein